MSFLRQNLVFTPLSVHRATDDERQIEDRYHWLEWVHADRCQGLCSTQVCLHGLLRDVSVFVGDMTMTSTDDPQESHGTRSTTNAFRGGRGFQSETGSLWSLVKTVPHDGQPKLNGGLTYLSPTQISPCRMSVSIHLKSLSDSSISWSQKWHLILSLPSGGMHMDHSPTAC